jgi:hypothetical protein
MYPHVKKQAGAGFTVNGVTYEAPDVPVLLQILNGANASELLPEGSIYPLEANKSVEISIPGGAPGGPVSVRGGGSKIVKLMLSLLATAPSSFARA